MQIRIVICDDQLASREKTKIALSRIEKETDYSFAISSYESGEELLSHFDKSN